MGRLGVLIATAVIAVSACSDKDSYEAAESGLREWLKSVHAGDAKACDLMTAEYRDHLASSNRGTNAKCDDAVESARSSANLEMPPADAGMDVPAWDPSGEALVEATHGDQVTGFWMEFQDGRWLVAGTAP